MKALIAEDNSVHRRVLFDYLSPYGIVTMVANGREAVEAFKKAHLEKKPFELICLDIEMPKMNGLDALKEIRRLEGKLGLSDDDHVKIIMVTSMQDKGYVLEAVKAKCDSYLAKPYDKEQLEKHLKDLNFI
jgi:two-component system chemotaxis response regulator CheY